ncbi:hypothetical protein FRC08_006447 [Ceratobasidium sp. 394]|nr:hypothetical protein FRC08_006447 [Ceratobasidium sp. 394]
MNKERLLVRVLSSCETMANASVVCTFNEAIAVNSTAFEDKNPETGELEFVGSKTKIALLRSCKDLKWAPYQQTRHGAEVVQKIPFSSEHKVMGVVVHTPDGKWRLYLKGAFEILTKMCKCHVVVHRPGPQLSDVKEVETAPITELEENISRTIIFYANQMLRTLALAYRDFEQWPPAGHTGAIDEVPYESIASDLTLIGIVGIEDPLRPGAKEAVQKCLGAGVTIKMCTGDNVLTARSIASQCSIITAGGIIMKGPSSAGFRPRSSAKSSPACRFWLVHRPRTSVFWLTCSRPSARLSVLLATVPTMALH